MSTLVETLAARASGVAATGLTDARAARRAWQAVADTAVAMLAGADSPEAILTRSAATRLDSNGRAVLVGTPATASPTAAALSNGTAAHALEIDDFGGPGHPGAVVIPAMLAIVDLTRPTGSEFLGAVLAGYEAATLAVELLGGYRAQTDRGWHVTGTCGPFGAAAAAGCLLKLDVKQMAHALAIAGSAMGAVWAFQADGAMTKRIHAGRAAELGLTAAVLASEGCTGPLQLFEAEVGGLIQCFGTGEVVDIDWEDGPAVLRAGFKSYASCRGVHWATDGILELLERGISADDVTSIELACPPHALKMFADRQPSSLVAAQLSLPFAAAAALLLGRKVNDAYRGDGWTNPDIHDGIARVQLVAAVNAGQPRVLLRLRDGRTMETTVPRASGEPGEPVTDDQLVSKIAEWTQARLSPTRAAELFAVCRDLAQTPNVDSLMALLTSPGGKTDA